MRYECQNCEKKFELVEGAEPRCPNCFWTTSVRPIDSERKADVKLPKETRPAQPKPTIKANWRLIFGFLICVSAALGIFYLFQSGAIQKTGRVIREKIAKPKSIQHIEAPKEVSASSAAAGSELLFSEDELKTLNQTVQFEIPRKLTEEENGILNRQVEINVNIQESQDLKFWTLDEFKEFLKSEQAKRQIFFSWGYEKSLIDLFKDHYLNAQNLFLAGNGEAARTELLTVLVIPLYSNDLRIHKSVGLVMLKGFIDDVVRKVKILNSYSAQTGILQNMNQLKEDYAGFLTLIGEKKWEDALAFADRLQEKAKELDVHTKQFDVQYPPIFAQIDSDIKTSLNVPAEDFTTISSDLNSFLADLRIKRSVIEQNTTQALEAAKKQYDSALEAVRNKNWAEARRIFETISYPSEVADDAKMKLAILSKLSPSEE